MASGKFSNPRPHRDEERQIEETFRQLTGKEPVKKTPPQQFDIPVEEAFLPVEEAFPQPFEDSFPIPGEPSRPRTSGAYERKPQPPRQESFDLRFEEELFDGPAEPEDQDFLDKALAFVNENKKLVLAFLCAAAMLMIVLTISIFFKGSKDPYGEKILNNIYIADISVSGLTKKEAVSVVRQATSQTYAVQNMVIDLAGTELALSPRDTGAKLDVQKAVDAAYAYGRTGTEEERQQAQSSLHFQPHVIALLPYLNLDEDYILDTLRSYAEDAGSTLTQTSYGLEGTQPELAADKFNAKAPTQTLVITMGTPGIGFDYQDVYNQVMDAYSLHQFLVTVEDVESAKDPDPIDLEAIYEEFYIEPVDAAINLQTYETIPGSYGYEFDLEEARKLVDNAEFGQELRIPMQYIEPEILDSDMLFRDVLGESTVSHSSDKNRNTNLALACEAINGTVVNPGEQFSFNEVVGNRTSGKGYKSAFEVIRDVSNEEDEEIMGGGISQVASALYHSVLLSDLQVDYRVSQDFAPGYIANGLDVLVEWRTPDFQFSNTTGYPIQIEASASKGKVTIQILGTDERSYYIKMESKVTATQEPGTRYKKFEFDNKEGLADGDVIRDGVAGFTVKTYKCKYDKANGNLLSRDFVATTQYEMVDEIVARVTPEPTTEAATEPATEPTTESTSEPSTEPSTAPTIQPTDPPETQAPATEPEASQSSEESAPAREDPVVENILPDNQNQDDTDNEA